MKALKNIAILYLLLSFQQGHAQDSLRLMSLPDYYKLVLSFHPLARQANTLPEAAKSEIRIALGSFDPLLKSDFNEKDFTGKRYWTVWESKLEVPVWFGTDIKVAWDKNTGAFLDNSQLTPSEGLTWVGITVPLGQGLLIDQRRAALQQAKLSAEMADAARITMINKLLLQVAKDYWDWVFTYNRWLLHEESLRLAQIRFNAVRDRVLLGDLPAIDSLEAYIEVQNRQTILAQSFMEYSNARLIAANNLWNDKGEPVIPAPEVIPALQAQDIEALSTVQLDILLKQAAANHPELLRLQLKRDQLDIDRRLAQEKLRPKLNLDYNFLRSGNSPWTTRLQEWTWNNNYKVGLNFSFPLFLREERGKLGLAKIKIGQLGNDQQQTAREITTRVQTAWNELSALLQQLEVQESVVLNNAKMLEGEQFRFNNGEGSVFLMNARENSLISSRIKLMELKTKYAKSKAYLYWAAGRFE